MAREKIRNLIQKSIIKLQKEKYFPNFKLPEIRIERPEEKIHGDYATNIAMMIAKQVKKNPLEIAELIKSKIKNQKLKILEKIEIAKPGFINFFLAKEYLQKEVKKILEEGEKFGQLNVGKNQKVLTEFISANPTGPLHIGNGRGAFFGDCLCNVLERAGYRVFREYFINDAKSNTQIKILGNTALGKDTAYLTKDLKLKIKNLKTKLKKISDVKEAGFLLAQELQKDIKNFIEKKLKIKFDNWVSEQKLFDEGKIEKVLNFLKKKNLVYQKEGALWLKLSKLGNLKDEVLIRRDGEATYFLSDIAYHRDKFERRFKKIINIWGADHQGHVPRMKAIAKIFNFKGDFEILISQIVTLKGGEKLSKRKGKIITLEELIKEVGLDVARFFYLKKSLDTPMEFDLKEAKSPSQENPVFYIQYAHARIHSILAKLKIKNQKSKIQIKNQNLKLLDHPLELELIKQLIKFPEVVEDTASDYQLQRIPSYALSLASIFHKFYEDCPILKEKEDLKNARLALILATQIILKNTLSLMGISLPERM